MREGKDVYSTPNRRRFVSLISDGPVLYTLKKKVTMLYILLFLVALKKKPVAKSLWPLEDTN